jgi:hypothetical protein
MATTTTATATYVGNVTFIDATSFCINNNTLYVSVPKYDETTTSRYGIIATYDLAKLDASNTPQLINPNLITIPYTPIATCISSDNILYISTVTYDDDFMPTGIIYKYNVTTGVFNSFITGLSQPLYIAINGYYLYVSDWSYNYNTNIRTFNEGIIHMYDTNNGAEINQISTTLLAPGGTTLLAPGGIAISDNILYVSLRRMNNSDDTSTVTIATYDATNLNPINNSLISLNTGYFNGGVVIAISDDGNFLYVVNPSTNTIGIYNANNGTVINNSLITLGSVSGIIYTDAYLYILNTNDFNESYKLYIYNVTIAEQVPDDTTTSHTGAYSVNWSGTDDSTDKIVTGSYTGSVTATANTAYTDAHLSAATDAFEDCLDHITLYVLPYYSNVSYTFNHITTS